MKIKLNERGFILAEFLIALPLLILLLYALVTLIIQTSKIAREQVADYVLETEAQEVLDRITADARTAYSVKIEPATSLIDAENLILKCHNKSDKSTTLTDNLEKRVYAVYSANGKPFHVYEVRQNEIFRNPITGGNSYGDTIVRQLKYYFVPEKKVLHITLEMESDVTKQKVKFTTAVYMPGYQSE
ncbi:MAG: hypothetical protein IJT73_06230 [Selenomonadaceae bacterium]|nr:hypothetical protein [Selenomonadaceae bacterium]